MDVAACPCGHPLEDHQERDAMGVRFRSPCRGWVWRTGTVQGRLVEGVAVCGCGGRGSLSRHEQGKA